MKTPSPACSDAFYVLDPGAGVGFQDAGRPKWRRFGVPPGGPMDDHAASWANQVLGNPLESPVLEILMQGAKLAAMRSLWIAITGAHSISNVPCWRAVHVQADDVLEFDRSKTGVWSYLAVEGGFTDIALLGSISASPRVALGSVLTRGSILRRSEGLQFRLPQGVAGRIVPFGEQRNYMNPPSLRLWPGPQWDNFPNALRHSFLSQTWTLGSRCDRAGYRLQGQPLKWPIASMISEPVRVGSVQLPDSGLPIVTLRDGPTIGGYPKIGYIDPEDLPWLVQCRTGQSIKFQWAQEGFSK